MSIFRLVIIFGLLIENMIWAASAYVPNELFFLAKPVDSLCFANLAHNNTMLDLTKCGVKHAKLTISGKNSKLINAGFVGFEWQDQNSAYTSQGSSYYKVFNAGKNSYWLYTINNNGGSGDFTAINLVQVKKTGLLAIRNIMQGDRCNSGIQDVQERNHHLFFSVNITAYDFLTLANDNHHHLNAYDDLAACATCCTAKVLYEIDSTFTPKLNAVDFGDYGANLNEMPSQGRYQNCFNKLLNTYVIQGESKLNNKKLKKLVQEFNNTCVLK